MGSTKKNPRPQMGPVLHGLFDSCPQSSPRETFLCLACQMESETDVPNGKLLSWKPKLTWKYPRFSIVFRVSICILIFFGWIGVPGQGPVGDNVTRTQLFNRESSLLQVNVLLLSCTVSQLVICIRPLTRHCPCHGTRSLRMM